MSAKARVEERVSERAEAARAGGPRWGGVAARGLAAPLPAQCKSEQGHWRRMGRGPRLQRPGQAQVSAVDKGGPRGLGRLGKGSGASPADAGSAGRARAAATNLHRRGVDISQKKKNLPSTACQGAGNASPCGRARCVGGGASGRAGGGASRRRPMGTGGAGCPKNSEDCGVGRRALLLERGAPAAHAWAARVTNPPQMVPSKCQKKRLGL